MHVKLKKLLVTALVWFTEGYTLGAFLAIYLLVKLFMQEHLPSSNKELIVLLFIAIFFHLSHKWLEKRYFDFVFATKARTIWRYCGFTVIYICICLIWGKILYDHFTEIIKSLWDIFISLITGLLVLLIGAVSLIRAHGRLREFSKTKEL